MRRRSGACRPHPWASSTGSSATTSRRARALPLRDGGKRRSRSPTTAAPTSCGSSSTARRIRDGRAPRLRDVGAEHPGHLLVLLHEAGEEVAGAGVAVLVLGGLEVRTKLADEALVVHEQVGQHLLGVRRLLGIFLQARALTELGERAERAAAHASGTLRDLVDELVERLVLGLEELVEVVELQALHVPVIVARLGVEHVFVCEDGGEQLHHALAHVVGYSDLGLHACASLSLYLRENAGWLRDGDILLPGGTAGPSDGGAYDLCEAASEGGGSGDGLRVARASSADAPSGILISNRGTGTSMPACLKASSTARPSEFRRVIESSMRGVQAQTLKRRPLSAAPLKYTMGAGSRSTPGGFAQTSVRICR